MLSNLSVYKISFQIEAAQNKTKKICKISPTLTFWMTMEAFFLYFCFVLFWVFHRSSEETHTRVLSILKQSIRNSQKYLWLEFQLFVPSPCSNTTNSLFLRARLHRFSKSKFVLPTKIPQYHLDLFVLILVGKVTSLMNKDLNCKRITKFLASKLFFWIFMNFVNMFFFCENKSKFVWNENSSFKNSELVLGCFFWRTLNSSCWEEKKWQDVKKYCFAFFFDTHIAFARFV